MAMESSATSCERASRDPRLSIHTLQNKNSSYYDGRFFRLLTDERPEAQYKPKEKDDDRTTVHYGQRKLHLSEVEFLTNCCDELVKLGGERIYKKIVLIYAGAAPGIHIDLLHSMFPFMKFVLIDPAKFQVNTSKMIDIYQELFTNEMALLLKEKYDGFTRLFISDIRKVGHGIGINDDELEIEIEQDMYDQMYWYQLLDPFKSMFKFRLPYVANRNNPKLQVSYLKGDIYLQLWAPNSSSETRLVVGEKASKQTYDSKKYENQMYRFNNIDRANCYEHEFGDVEGLDHCYDCRGEVFVFSEYIKKLPLLQTLNRNSKQELPATTKSVRDYVIELNEHLQADQKMIRFMYNKKNYEARFTAIKYGKKFDEVCKESSNLGYKKWSRPTNIDQLVSNNMNRFNRNRLNFSNSGNQNEVKRLGVNNRPFNFRNNYDRKYDGKFQK